MTPKAKSTALVLSGAVALSFTAYAIGSQTGGGTAGAESASSKTSASSTTARPTFRRGGFGRGHGGPGGPGFFGPALDDLATKLGVSTSALQQAFEDARAALPKPADRRDDHLRSSPTRSA